jgi:hypothetical protein
MQVISLVGFAKSGKDTAARHLVEQHGFIPFSFAEALKDALAAIFCWERSMLEGITPQSRAWREQVDPWWEERLGIKGFSPRMAMQLVGTNLFREHFNQNIWINNIDRKLSLLPADSRVVLIDGRFPNELDLGRKKYGSTVIRVKRGPEPPWWDQAMIVNGYKTQNDQYIRDTFRGGWIADGGHYPLNDFIRYDLEKKAHESEWAWIGYPVDVTLHNEKTIEALHEGIARLALAA